MNIIENHNTSKPLFLYVASLAPHAPYQAPKQAIDAYKNAAGDEHRHIYAAMITELDTQVGRIVAALKQKNMFDNTLIIFSSDNGGATSALFATGARAPDERAESGGVEIGAKTPASNGDLRGGKGSLHEGGVRVPTIFSWPAKLKPKVVNEPLSMVANILRCGSRVRFSPLCAKSGPSRIDLRKKQTASVRSLTLGSGRRA